MLTTLTIVSVLTSFMIFTIIQSNSNSSEVIKKVLTRLDHINNATIEEQNFTHTVQKIMLELQYAIATNKTSQIK